MFIGLTDVHSMCALPLEARKAPASSPFNQQRLTVLACAQSRALRPFLR